MRSSTPSDGCADHAPTDSKSSIRRVCADVAGPGEEADVLAETSGAEAGATGPHAASARVSSASAKPASRPHPLVASRPPPKLLGEVEGRRVPACGRWSGAGRLLQPPL